MKIQNELSLYKNCILLQISNLKLIPAILWFVIHSKGKIHKSLAESVNHALMLCAHNEVYKNIITREGLC